MQSFILVEGFGFGLPAIAKPKTLAVSKNQQTENMTSIDFLIKIYDLINNQDYRITFSPAKKKNFMMMCNGHFIGGLFDEELYFVYTEVGGNLLNNPEPVYKGYSADAQHKMLSIPLDIAKDILKATYNEKFDWSNFVCDISYHFTINRSYPEHIVKSYDLFLIFLRFCYEKKLLKLNPIDKNNRILYMNYMNKDLTDNGVIIFNDLIHKWLSYTDRTNKIDNLKMLEKYYITILQEKELTE